MIKHRMIPLLFLVLSYASALTCIVRSAQAKRSLTRRIDESRETCYFLINRISQLGVERDRYRRESERLDRRIASLERRYSRLRRKSLVRQAARNTKSIEDPIKGAQVFLGAICERKYSISYRHLIVATSRQLPCIPLP